MSAGSIISNATNKTARNVANEVTSLIKSGGIELENLPQLKEQLESSDNVPDSEIIEMAHEALNKHLPKLNKKAQVDMEQSKRATISVQVQHQKWVEAKFKPLVTSFITDHKVLIRNTIAAINEFMSPAPLSPLVLDSVAQLHVRGKKDSVIKQTCEVVLHKLFSRSSWQAEQIINWYQNNTKELIQSKINSLKREGCSVQEQPLAVISQSNLDASLLYMLRMKVPLSRFDRSRWGLYGGMALSTMASMIFGFLPGFIAWFFTTPAMIAGFFMGIGLWWDIKEGQVEKEMQMLCGELLRRVQIKVIQQIYAESDAVERNVQRMFYHTLWKKQEERDLQIQQIERKYAETLKQNNEAIANAQNTLKKLVALRHSYNTSASQR